MNTTDYEREAQQLVEQLARLSRLGVSPGSSGNGSVRVGDLTLITPSGADLGALEASELSVVDAAGRLLSGGRPSKELPLHEAMYEKNPDCGAVIHLHSTYAVAASCLQPWSPTSAIAPLTPYFVMKVGQTPLLPYFAPGSPDGAEAVRALKAPARAMLLRNHGSLVAGVSPSAAADAAIELEETARLQVLLRGQDVVPLTEADIRELDRRFTVLWDLPRP